MKTFLLAIMILGATSVAQSQQISPPVTETKMHLGKKFSGEVTLTNNALVPIVATISARSFKVNSDGQAAGFTPLTPGTEVDLDKGTVRIPPKSSYIVGWNARCQSDCSFVVLADFSGQHTQAGLSVVFRLGDVIYACEQAKDCRTRLRTKLMADNR